jgi:hypothetical protein
MVALEDKTVAVDVVVVGTQELFLLPKESE